MLPEIEVPALPDAPPPPVPLAMEAPPPMEAPAPIEAPMPPPAEPPSPLALDDLVAAELAATTPRAPEPPVVAPPEPPPVVAPAATGPEKLTLPPAPATFELPPTNPTPPPLLRQAPAAPPVARDWSSEAAESAPVTTQMLDDGAMAAARARSGGFVFLAILCGAIALGTLFGTAPGEFGFFTLVLLTVLVVGVIVFVRKAIYYSAIDTVDMTPQYQPVLGAPLPVKVDIAVLQSIPITDVEVTLTARERAINRSGKSETTYQEEIYTQTVRVEAGGTWNGGQAVRFTAPLVIPPEMPASFAGKHNFIEWTATLWVGIPGWYPDIRHKLPLTVRPLVAGVPPLASEPRTFPLPVLGDLHAQLQFTCAMTEGWPVLQAGSEIPFILTMDPLEAASNQRLRIELAYHITGAGDDEGRTVAAVTCFPGGWTADSSAFTEKLFIPADAPVSYEGRHIRTRWTLILRREIPWHPDQVQTFGVVVVPAAISAEAYTGGTERRSW
ncbi:MAG: hypothetical protein BWY76_02745 [bacterium ADurb.Bin429]|nr:MAG: hypothetical protein BWY76_02745 [bacterium ADurb.Bin429]